MILSTSVFCNIGINCKQHQLKIIIYSIYQNWYTFANTK